MSEGANEGSFYPGVSNNGIEDFEITRDEVDKLKEALKSEKFRGLLCEYVDDVQKPENVTLYQNEVRQLEEEKGNVVHFLNPVFGYVIKTSVNGEKKAFINICSNPLVQKITLKSGVNESNERGVYSSIPLAQSHQKKDFDKDKRPCLVYDVIFHPETIQWTKNEQLRAKIEETALEAVEKAFNVSLDKNNIRRPRLKYKGPVSATIIRYKKGENPPTILDTKALPQELSATEAAKLGSQKEQSFKKSSNGTTETNNRDVGQKREDKEEIAQTTEPKFAIKFRNHVELEDYTFLSQTEGSTKHPQEIIVTIDLPLLKNSNGLNADVIDDGWFLELTTEKNAKAGYYLRVSLPFQVVSNSARAQFDTDKRQLIVVLKTVHKNLKLDLKPVNDEKEGGAVIKHKEKGAFKESGSKLPKDSTVIPKTVDDNESPEANEHDSLDSITSSKAVPLFENADIVTKSILKYSLRSRSMSESYADDVSSSSYSGKEFMSLDNLNESDEQLHLDGSATNLEKSVRFSDSVQRQLYRSNSSILGQRKKNQRKSRSKRKNRERANSEGSVSSMDDDGDTFAGIRRSQYKKVFTDGDSCDNDGEEE